MIHRALAFVACALLAAHAWGADNFTPMETPLAVSATTSSSATSFTLTSAIAAPDVKVCDIGSTMIYWQCGNSAVQACVPGAGCGSTPLQPTLCGVYHKGSGSTTCAAITASGNSTVTFTAGEGN